MASRKSAEVEVTESGPEVEVEETQPEKIEYVTREEHDLAIRYLTDQVGELRQHVEDLNQIVTQPEGAVRFLDIQGPQDEQPPLEPFADVPMFAPKY